MNVKFDEKEYSYLVNNRMDDALATFTARQLTYVRAQTLQAKKPPLEAFTVFPVQTDVPAGAETAIQITYDGVGMAEVITNYADDLPRVDVFATEQAVKVHSIGAAYGYNRQEIENAMFAKVNLSSTQAEQAKRGVDLRINKLAWHGDKTSNIIGFLNNPNISEYSVKADGTGSSTKFANKTVEQILRDLNEFFAVIRKATNNVERPNTLLLPPSAYAHLATTPRSDNSDKTILDFIKQVYPNLTRIIEVNELENADGKGKDMMFAGVFDPTYVRLEIPNRFDQLPVQERNLEYVVNCVSRVIGVNVVIPMAFVKAVGV